MSEFKGLSDIEAQLKGETPTPEEPGTEEANNVDLGSFTALMRDRNSATTTAAMDETAQVRITAMQNMVFRSMTETVAEQQLISWAIGLTQGQELPPEVSVEERILVQQFAQVLRLRATGRKLGHVQPVSTAAIEGLRSLPAVSQRLLN